MTTQELFAQLQSDGFSEATMQRVYEVVGNATEVTPELAALVAEALEDEIDEDLADVEIDPETMAEIEKEASKQLAEIEDMANESLATTQKNLSELADLDKKIDVLERLHPAV